MESETIATLFVRVPPINSKIENVKFNIKATKILVKSVDEELRYAKIIERDNVSKGPFQVLSVLCKIIMLT